MDRRTSAKVASLLLYVHGFIEIAAIMLLALPSEYFAASVFQEGRERMTFMALLSVIYGSSRLVAGYSVWSMKKWGIVFGMTLSIVTMIVAPSIYPFGVMDLLLAVPVLIFLLYLWFKDEVIAIPV